MGRTRTEGGRRGSGNGTYVKSGWTAGDSEAARQVVRVVGHLGVQRSAVPCRLRWRRMDGETRRLMRTCSVPPRTSGGCRVCAWCRFVRPSRTKLWTFAWWFNLSLGGSCEDLHYPQALEVAWLPMSDRESIVIVRRSSYTCTVMYLTVSQKDFSPRKEDKGPTR
jgi:hypothetical protein